MAPVRSKLTAQGQISVPASIRKKLGIRPGSLIEWHDEAEQVVVRRAGRVGHFRRRPALGFSDCFVVAIARRAGHVPLGTFERRLAALDDVTRV